MNKVGDGGTMCYYSDRRAVTVVEVSASGKIITVQEDTSVRVDDRGMSDAQDYTYTPNPAGQTHKVSLRKNGRYVVEGQNQRGTRCALGERRSYHDYSF